MGPIRGQTRPLPVEAGIMPEARHIDAKLNASIHNRFDIEVVDSKTGHVKQKAQAENVILNNCWEYMFSNSSTAAWFNSIQYGSGAGAPAVTDTQLFTRIGGVKATLVATTFDSLTGVAKCTKKIILTETMNVGSTITEIGIGLDGSSGLCTHAMLKDMNGNPISIKKTNTDIITMYATVFCHFNAEVRRLIGFGPSSAIVNFGLGLASICVPVTSTNITAYGEVSGGSFSGGTFSSVAATKTQGYAGLRLGATIANEGLYLIAEWDNSVFYVDEFSTGTSIAGEAIGTGNGATKDFSTEFGMVKGGVKIYVDGVEQVSGVTVNLFHPKNKTSHLTYMRAIDEFGNYSERATIGTLNSNITKIFYNPYFTHFGMKTFIVSQDGYGPKTALDVSNDLGAGFTRLANEINGTAFTVPEQYRYYKYWKFTPTGGNYNYVYVNGTATDELTDFNIHFDTPPANGAVITADYNTALIAKDANHVFDFSLAIQFGEHTT